MNRESHAAVAKEAIRRGSVRFEIPCPPNFENERMHWAVKSKAIREAREATRWAIIAARAMPTSHDRLLMATEPRKRVVSFVRFFGGKVREMDPGGLVSACKPVLDALKLVVGHKRQYGRMVEIQGAGLLFDDSAKWVTTLYEQVKDKSRAGQLEVEIT